MRRKGEEWGGSYMGASDPSKVLKHPNSDPQIDKKHNNRPQERKAHILHLTRRRRTLQEIQHFSKKLPEHQRQDHQRIDKARHPGQVIDRQAVQDREEHDRQHLRFPSGEGGYHQPRVIVCPYGNGLGMKKNIRLNNRNKYLTLINATQSRSH